MDVNVQLVSYMQLTSTHDVRCYYLTFPWCSACKYTAFFCYITDSSGRVVVYASAQRLSDVMHWGSHEACKRPIMKMLRRICCCFTHKKFGANKRGHKSLCCGGGSHIFTTLPSYSFGREGIRTAYVF